MTAVLGQWLPEEMSVAEQLASLSEEDRKQIELAMSDDQKRALRWDWDFWARPDQKAPPDFSVWLVLWGRGVGKALALDTPIPTHDGWSTMGQVQVGDRLLDCVGHPAVVTFVTDVQHGRKCFEVEFDDGAVIVADAEHLWSTSATPDRRAIQSVRTTEAVRLRIRNGQPNWVQRVERIPLVCAQSLGLRPSERVRSARQIVDVRAVTSVPVRCLTVDSPDHLYLAGEAMIPTHNTKTGSEWVRSHAPRHAEGLLIGANPRDARDLMIEGPSGIITISPPWEKPVYEPTKLLLRWPNGAVAHVRSAEDPEGIRGLSVEWAWVDELGKHRFAQETWDQRALALREGSHPQTVVTSTPTPTTLIKKLASGDGHGIVVAPRVSTYRNAANLAPDFFRTLLDQYEGSRFGRQELHAEILSDIKGALWSWEMIEKARWKGEWIDSPAGKVPDLRAVKRKVVGVDPSGSTTGDEWGIIVAGSDRGRPPCGYVLADRSQRGSPEDCARAAVRAYYDFNCDEMVAESNFGGEMVGRMIFNVLAEGVYPAGSSVRFKSVRAGKGQSKYERAVPVVGFYEQNVRGFRRVYHVGVFPELEQQMTEWVPPEQADGVEVFKSSWSPDRVDAAVYALLELLVMNARRAGRAEGDVLRSASIG